MEMVSWPSLPGHSHVVWCWIFLNTATTGMRRAYDAHVIGVFVDCSGFDFLTVRLESA